MTGTYALPDKLREYAERAVNLNELRPLMVTAAGAIERLQAALQEIRDDDAGDKAYGYRDAGMAYDRMQRLARNALLAD